MTRRLILLDSGTWVDFRGDCPGCKPSAGSEARWSLPVAALLGCAALAVTIYLMIALPSQ
jgi:hypothetical protein